MSVEQYLPSFRGDAEALMLDVGTASRPTGEWVPDEVTQREVEYAEPLFDSPAKLQARTIQPREEEVGARTATTVRMELHLPVSSPPLEVGDHWKFHTVHPLSTTDADTTWRVLAPVGKTFATARRYEVEAVVR